MDLDPDLLFGKCHRIYVQAVRDEIRKRLEAHYGEEWWQKGVLTAFRDDTAEYLKNTTEKMQEDNYRSALDTRHFGYIVDKSHGVAFRDAFPDSVRAFKRFGRITKYRNDWAHVQDMSLADVHGGIRLMQDILANLNRTEALELDKILGGIMVDEKSSIEDEQIQEIEPPAVVTDAISVLDEPVESWRRLQDYLRVTQTVEYEDSEKGSRRSVVSVRLENVAPEGPEWPSVVFRDIQLSSGLSIRERSITKIDQETGETIRYGSGETPLIDVLHPGQDEELVYDLSFNNLLNWQLSVSARIDGESLLLFKRSTELSANITAEVRQHFAAQFKEIGVEALVKEAMETLNRADPNTPTAEMMRLRQSASDYSERAKTAIEALDAVYRDFQLDKTKGLGVRTHELNQTLTSFSGAMEEFDKAAGGTDPDAIEVAKRQIQEAQMAVLRVESELRAIGGS